MNEKTLCELLSLVNSNLEYNNCPFRKLLIDTIQLNLCKMFSENKELKNTDYFKGQIGFWLNNVKQDISGL